MPVTGFEPGERVLLLDDRGRRYLITLQQGQSYHFHRGIVAHDLLIGQPEGVTVRTTSGAAVIALRPTFAEFVLKMKRGAQVVYPKDLAMILLHGDVYPGANVLEAGAGSGALTMALLRAVGPEGRVVTYELREDFAALARSNVEAFLGKAENLEIKIGSVYEPVEETGIDRIVLDVPEPWRVLEGAARALRPGGIFVAYLPTVLQIHSLVEALHEDPSWTLVSSFETLVRPWHVEGRSVRPEHRMVAHTGFITTARRILAPKFLPSLPDRPIMQEDPPIL
ncbi:MAG: tRNA (adenine-N1)-methyltransferase [Actinobacteria bacterium]|nr:MAG: tRNA (adenine-N1)-methyltransferase [Actinomycetota bacterium]